MRIGFFAGKFLRGGSKQTSVRPLAKALSKLGHQVFILDLSPWHTRMEQVDGLNVYTISTRQQLLHNPLDAFAVLRDQYLARKSCSDGAEPRAFDLFLGKIQKRFVEDCQLDVLYSLFLTNFPGLCHVRLPNEVLVAVNFIGFGINPRRGGSNSFPYQKYIFERPFWDLQITATRFELEQYQKVYEAVGMPSDKLSNLPHSFDEDLFRPQHDDDIYRLRQKYGLNSDQRILVYPVQVYPRKNIELAIKILAQIPLDISPVLIITGQIYDQDYFSSLLSLIQELGVEDKVRFLKGVSVQELAEIYSLADITVFPSHQETFGLGIVESLGSGIPVIGPGYIHACREILNDSYGAWTASKDIDDFRAKILAVIQNPPDKKRVAAEARDCYGNSAVARRWLVKVIEMYKMKLSRFSNLKNIDWEGLYEDDLDLLTSGN